MAGSFSAQIDAFVLKTQRRADAVLRQASQEVIADMQRPVATGGNMPVDTGFLRASLVTTINAPVNSVSFRDGGSHSFNEGSVILALNSAKFGDSIFAVYTANYAGHVEYGSQGRPPRAFVRSAAQNWQSIVKGVVGRLR